MNANKRKDTFVHRFPYDLDSRDCMPDLGLEGLNALSIATGIFEIEKATKQRIVRRAVLPLFGARALGYELKRLRERLQELLLFVLVEDIEIAFQEEKPYLRKKRKPSSKPQPVASVCLFSGGTDSYAGLLLAKERLDDVAGVFCAHSDQARMVAIVQRIQQKFLIPQGITVFKQRVPRIEAHGYAQLRGFLYIVAAGAWVHLLGARKLLVTECGPTMYQPRFSPFDSVTLTTHPFVVKLAREVMNLLLRKSIHVITPFEDLTKAEVMALTPQRKGLPYTHSCVTQRFGRHDGTCYGCVIRRLAAIAAGVEDVRYDANPIVNDRANTGNLLTLLAYCSDVMLNYKGMDEFETENIRTFAKQDLFSRFALDNFAAIHQLFKDGKRVSPSVRKIYSELTSVLGTEMLDKRIKSLRRASFGSEF